MKRRQFLQAIPQSRLFTRFLAKAGSLAMLSAGLSAWRTTWAGTAPSCSCGSCPSCLNASGTETPAIAFYYGHRIPLDDLRAFDWVVLEPEHALAQDPDVVQTLAPQTLALAYVSLGEVRPDRPYYNDIPKAWLPGANPDWGSRVIDQTAAGWPQFLQQRIIGPLWKAGFHAFFLDTLDSYQFLAKTDAERKHQAEALQATLRSLMTAFPGIRFLPNRGFEVMDATLAQATLAVAAESLFRGWNAASKQYVEVAEPDRQWLLARFAELRSRYKLSGVAIDYVATGQRPQARETARSIAAAGLIPWVTDPALESMGVGTVELVPRRVLLLHSCPEGDSPELLNQSAHLYGAMPLEYLGLVPEYRYIGAPAITEPLTGRYAGVVLWADSSDVPGVTDQLLARARAEGLPVAILGQLDPSVLTAFGLQVGQEALPGPLTLLRQPGTPNGEIIPLVAAANTVKLDAGPGSRVWLRATAADGQTMDGAAITPWGGYALGNFGVFNLPGDTGTRWSIDPIAFFRDALRVTDAPMPDITTRTGRRAFFVHFDADGWVNACDRPGSPLACEVIVTDYLEKYRTPTLGSIIVAEVSHEGLYPALADQGQKWARRMFALPHVEAGSHTWSHPFDWVAASDDHSRGKTTKALPYGNYLPVPNYTFSTETEVVGARDYIQNKLCPPGKPCDMILWPGDCNPPNKAVALTYKVGMRNINGGGATITRTSPTLSRVWPMGIPKGHAFQVYAACSNEEVYTHNWTGPYFGFERAIETYQMTDSPRRLKALDVYFHPYIVTKQAGAMSLHKAWQWAMSQPTHPIFGRQYSDSVLAWRQATVATLLDGGWRLRGHPELRQWRVGEQMALPDLEHCRAIAGHTTHAGMRYVHATSDQAILRVGGQSQLPHLIDANADITRFEAIPGGGWVLEFAGHVPLQANLTLPPGWRVQAEPTVQVQLGAGTAHIDSRDTHAALRILPKA